MTLSRYFIERHRFVVDDRLAEDLLAVEWLEAARSTIGRSRMPMRSVSAWWRPTPRCA